MTVTIPRDEIHAVAKRYSINYDLDFDPSAEWVRATAAHLRSGGDFGSPSAAVMAEADDLDALVDRVEKEANG